MNSASSQCTIPDCGAYKRYSASDKIFKVEVFDKNSGSQLAAYEFDKQGYILKFDTLLHPLDKYPSQSSLVQFSSDRANLKDSTINYSKSYYHKIPPNAARVILLNCGLKNKSMSIVDYDLSRKNLESAILSTQNESNCDTVYRISEGKREVRYYYKYYTEPSTGITQIEKINVADRSIEEFKYGTQNQLIYYDNGSLTREFTYNDKNLLLEMTEYERISLDKLYDHGKPYNSLKWVYNYEDSKLVRITTYACYRKINIKGTATFVVVGEFGFTNYKYSKKSNLLIEMRDELHTYVFKYQFFK